MKESIKVWTVGILFLIGIIMLLNEMMLFLTIIVGVGCIALAIYLYNAWGLEEEEEL